MHSSTGPREPRRRLRTAWMLIHAACIAAFFLLAPPRTPGDNAPAKRSETLASRAPSADAPTRTRHLRPGETPSDDPRIAAADHAPDR